MEIKNVKEKENLIKKEVYNKGTKLITQTYVPNQLSKIIFHLGVKKGENYLNEEDLIKIKKDILSYSEKFECKINIIKFVFEKKTEISRKEKKKIMDIFKEYNLIMHKSFENELTKRHNLNGECYLKIDDVKTKEQVLFAFKYYVKKIIENMKKEKINIIEKRTTSLSYNYYEREISYSINNFERTIEIIQEENEKYKIRISSDGFISKKNDVPVKIVNLDIKNFNQQLKEIFNSEFKITRLQSLFENKNKKNNK